MTNKTLITLSIIFLSFSCQNFQKDRGEVPSLRVSKNGHFLETIKGDPFFWLGDTGWRLFNNLTADEAAKYLEERKEQGFNVIQCQLLPSSSEGANIYGYKPFADKNVRQPVEEYWQHVDTVLDMAAGKGLYMAVLPAWGRTYIEIRDESENPKLLTNDPEGAYDYGNFIGHRYQKFSNLIWILGGDTWGRRDTIYDMLAAGITDGYGKGDPDKVLLSFHPQGGTYRPPATSSGEFYHHKDWLDFNMIQSGHRIGNLNYERINEDYHRKPVKPTIDGEPCYEHHPVKHDFSNGEFNAWNVRRRGYWSVLAGAFGFTYGGNGIWQMATPERPGKASHFNYYWYQAIDFEGAKEMIYLRRLFESRPFIHPERVPDQSLLVPYPDSADSHLQCARADDFSYVIVYSTNGSDFFLQTEKLKDNKYVGWWYDPRTGFAFGPDSAIISDPFEVEISGQQLNFDPPGEEGPSHDWVLVLDNVKSSYTKPGS